MNANELKPCPFCGGNGRLTVWTPNAASVSCICCGAHINTNAAAEAVEAWNTRAEEPERTCGLRSRLTGLYCYECSVCGTGLHPDCVYCPECGAKVVHDAD